MKTQVLSIEQMKHLQELGVDTSKAKMAWYDIYETLPEWYNELNIRDDVFDKNYPSVPTFTLQDMLEMMPKTILFNEDVYHFEMLKWNERYAICYGRVNDDNELAYCVIIIKHNILTCAYKALCWLAEKAKDGDMLIPEGEPADLILVEWQPIYRALGRDAFIEHLKKNQDLKEAKKYIKQLKSKEK